MVTFTQYNLTGMTQTSNTTNTLVNFIQTTNAATNYLPGIFINLMVYIVIFLALKMRGTSGISAFASCNFMNVILGLLMFALKLIPGWYLIIIIIALPASFLMLFVGDKYY